MKRLLNLGLQGLLVTSSCLGTAVRSEANGGFYNRSMPSDNAPSPPATVLIAQETSPTRIQFASGSYCGSYSGEFGSGRSFVLNLDDGQTLSIRPLDETLLAGITVQGPTGKVPVASGTTDRTTYQVLHRGNHTIFISSETPSASVEFCAY